MALFVLGTSVSLMAGPWLLLRMQHLGWVNGQWGVRLAGLALAVSAGCGAVHGSGARPGALVLMR